MTEQVETVVLIGEEVIRIVLAGPAMVDQLSIVEPPWTS